MSALIEVVPQKPKNAMRVGIRNGAIVFLKICIECNQEKIATTGPESEYALNGRKANGNPTWKSRCRLCQREYQRAYREANREHLRAKRNANYARRKTEDPEWMERRRVYSREQKRKAALDPVKRARARAQSREWKRARRLREPEKVNEELRMWYALRRERQGHPIRRRPGNTYDAIHRFLRTDRFYDWFAAYRALSACSRKETAKSLGLSERQGWEAEVRRNKWIEYDVVDRTLAEAGYIVVLDDTPIYGIDDLYPNDPGIPRSELVGVWQGAKQEEQK